MKAIIEENGWLSIERPGGLKKQCCMFGATFPNGDIFCGDWCPAFREPYTQKENSGKTIVVELQLCQQVGTLCFDEVEDQRRDA